MLLLLLLTTVATVMHNDDVLEQKANHHLQTINISLKELVHWMHHPITQL